MILQNANQRQVAIKDYLKRLSAEENKVQVCNLNHN